MNEALHDRDGERPEASHAEAEERAGEKVHRDRVRPRNEGVRERGEEGEEKEEPPRRR